MNQHNRHQHDNRVCHAGAAQGRGGRGHHAHHPEFGGPPESGGPPHPGGRGFGGGNPGERGGRARRGEARHLLLDELRDGPKHGYEIIKALELRSGGQYAPSPGTIYPTLQFLEDAGLIRAEQQNERKVYELTETGRAELEARAAEIAAFWARQAGPTPSPASQTEIRFLREEMEGLTRTARGGVHEALQRDDSQTIRRVREAIEQCRSEVRRLLSEAHNEPKAV